MTGSFTELRWLWIDGPDVRFTKDDPARPLWSVQIGAPFRGKVWPEQIHPARLLGQDETSANADGMARPTQISVRVCAGMPAGSWAADNGGGNEILRIATVPYGHEEVVNPPSRGPIWSTRQVPNTAAEALMVPLILRPDAAWPAHSDPNIAMPPMRLAAGALPVYLYDAPGANLVLAMLRKLFQGGLDAPYEITLTKDGILLSGMLPFPGQANPLPGDFLLSGRADGTPGLSLTLRTGTSNAAGWMKAWRRLCGAPATPGGYGALRTRRSGPPPAFVWTVESGQAGNGTVGERIGMRPEDLTLLLSGTDLNTAGRDGVLWLRGTAPTLSGGANTATLQLSADPSDAPAAPALTYTYNSAVTNTAASQSWTTGTQALTTDEMALAALLRTAHGLPAPQINPAPDDPAPPLLFGFTPLRNGWLQWPVPNLPPPDPDDDAQQPGLGMSQPRNSLDGFLRLSNSMAASPTASWSMMLEAAAGFDATVTLGIADDSASITGITANFLAPKLRLNGVLWTSLDRPDSEEAVPRLSAGAACLCDVALTNADQPLNSLAFSLKQLSITLPAAYPAAPAKPPPPAIALGGLDLTISWCGGTGAASSFTAMLLARPPLAERMAAIAGFMDVAWVPPPVSNGTPMPAAAQLRQIKARMTLLQAQIDSLRGQITGQDQGPALTTDQRNFLSLKLTAATSEREKLDAGLQAAENAALAEAAVQKAALADASTARQTWVPASPRAIAWCRHPILPLAATMPMTRSGESSAMPLESRDLAPFIVAPSGQALCDLSWDLCLGAAGLSDADLGKLVSAWPAATGAATGTGQTPPVIAFAVLTVTGVVLVPTLGWSASFCGYRMDAPALDGAFALTQTPPVAPVIAPDAQDDPPPAPTPIATALDLAGLEVFFGWRGHQWAASQVQTSMLIPFQFQPLPGAAPVVATTALLEPFTWPVTAIFNLSTAFGSVSFTPGIGPLSGTAALQGPAGKLQIDPASSGTLNWIGNAQPGGGEMTIDVTGWSPATYGAGGQQGPQIDNRGLAAWPSQTANGLVLRPIHLAAAPAPAQPALWLTTLKAPLDTEEGLQFWFREVPLQPPSGGKWVFDAGSAPAIDADAFSPASVALNGFEWRLYRNTQPPQDTILLGGFTITPLRLRRLVLEAGTADPTAPGPPAYVEILAALSLSTDPAADAVPVRLCFGPGTNAPLKLDSILTLPAGGSASGQKAPLQLRLLAQHNTDGTPDVAVDLSFTPTKIATDGTFIATSAQAAFWLYGVRFSVVFDTVTVNSDGVMTFTANPPPPPAADGSALLKLKSVSFTAGAKPILTTVIEVLIKPVGARAAVLRHTVGCDKLVLMGTVLNLGGPLPPGVAASLPFAPEQPNVPDSAAALGAVAVTGAGSMTGDLFDGWRVQAGAGMLAASASPPGDQPLSYCLLRNGRAELVTDTCRIVLTDLPDYPAMAFADTPPPWRGSITLNTVIQAKRSAISWPTPVAVPSGPIPGPWQLTLLATPACTHNVTLCFDGQSLKFEWIEPQPPAAAEAANGWYTPASWTLAQPVTFPLAVFHEFNLPSGGPVKWRALEAIALQPAAKFAVPGSGAATRSFAARYKAGAADMGDLLPREQGQPAYAADMPFAGVGDSSYVLQGQAGSRFQAAWRPANPQAGWTPPVDGLIISGAFTGLADGEGGAMLVRLPWIITTAPGVVLPNMAQNGEATLSLNWSDAQGLGPIADAGRLPLPAPTSSAAGIAELCAAAGGGQPQAPSAAIPRAIVAVEQAYRTNAHPPGAPDLTTECFWPGALASLKPLAQGNAPNAAIVLLEDRVVLVRCLNQPFSASGGAMPGALLTGGTGAVTSDIWPQKRIATATSLAALQPVLAIAAQRHLVAAFAIVSGADAGGNYGFSAVELPVPLRPPAAAKDSGISTVGMCPEPQLGWPAAPMPLQVVENGPMQPVQAIDQGLSGLMVQRVLPAGASKASLVWLYEMETPAWFSYPYGDLQAAPLPWLQVAPARALLPQMEAVRQALAAAQISEFQAFVPSEERHLASGGRAGVMTIRRLAAAAPLAIEPQIFDPAWRRGVPAELGPAIPVQQRVPRALSYPSNTGSAQSDMRPRARAEDWARNCALLRGPVDAVWGSDGERGWTVLVGLAPQKADDALFNSGVMLLPWDGTITLVLDVSVSGQPGVPPGQFINQQLLRTPPQGVLILGSQTFVLQFGAVTAPPAAAWIPLAAGGALHGSAILPVMAIAPNGGAGAGEAIAGAVMAAGGAAAGELRLTLVPGDPAPPAAGMLPTGASRVPATPRLKISVFDRARPRLQTLPATVIFSDPAYDRALTKQPCRTLQLITGIPADAQGQLFSILYTDQLSYCTDDVILMMADIGHHVRQPHDPDGTATLQLTVTLLPRDGTTRPLSIAGNPQATLYLAAPCSLDIKSLYEQNGAQCQLQPGDTLQFAVEPASAANNGAPGSLYKLTATVAIVAAAPEPPAFLYAALLAQMSGGTVKNIAVPLYAQSPLPSRLDATALRDDFRVGLVRWSAVFTWPVSRPADEIANLGAFVLKMGRNGQGHVPSKPEDFTTISDL